MFMDMAPYAEITVCEDTDTLAACDIRKVRSEGHTKSCKLRRVGTTC